MYQDRIISESLAQIRTFLDEVANGTANYRTLHSLTEQVEHQYHGRFAIELLQNAHDALREGGRVGRVHFRMVREEGDFGTLYIANDGQPFLEKDFLGLARLGQSAKNPEESVGNKGLGFRSVLEVCRAPEIYSRAGKQATGLSFDGYCFAFDPEVMLNFAPAFRDLTAGRLDTPYPLASEHRLVMWPQERLDEFRSRLRGQPEGWLDAELTQLSPYLLPMPRYGERRTLVEQYASDGFATVVRLPLASEAALEIVSSRLGQVADDEVAILFLEHLESLRISTEIDVQIHRVSRRRGDALNGERVTLEKVEQMMTAPSKPPQKRRTFWLWSRTFGGDGSAVEAGEIQRASALLPGRWPELRKATLSVAVELTLDEPQRGAYSIVLPTDLPTGFAAHFSGPFYGTMDRRSISFDATPTGPDDRSLNGLFLSYLARLVSDIVHRVLLGKGLREAAAVLDLVAPLPSVKAHATLFQQSFETVYPIADVPFLLTDTGWSTGSIARLSEPIENARVLTPRRLRELSPFPLVREELRPRYPALRALLTDQLGHNGSPSEQELAKLIERAAKSVADSGISQWDDFWRDIRRVPAFNRASLRSVRVLLGSDQRLHAPGGKVRVFFPPQQGVTDGAEAELIGSIPESLQARFSFLNDSIPLYEARAGGGVRTTEIHTFLSAPPALVHAFAAEAILDQVVLPNLPALPAPHGSPEGHQCHEILRWTRALLKGREIGSLAAKLRRLPVPAKAGWVASGEASFGPGWDDGTGEAVAEFLAEASTIDAEEALDRVLRPPGDAIWNELGDDLPSFLGSLGVVHGMRLREVPTKAWSSTVSISAGWTQMPQSAPDGLTPIWDEYRVAVTRQIRSRYQSVFAYQFDTLYTIPGLERCQQLSEAGRLAFARAVLGSISAWPKEWRRAVLRKIHGESHSTTVVSPLDFTLSRLHWLCNGRGERKEFGPPSAFWLVGAELLRTGEYQYAHLRPISLELVQDIGKDAVATLSDLGTPVYSPGAPTSSPRLLEDLARAWREAAADINQDRFVGQIRSAWQDFHPDDSANFPEGLVVRVGGALQVRVPSPDEPVYLPDSQTSRFGPAELAKLPVLEIVSVQANRLANFFETAFGDAVRRISTLRLEATVNGEDWSPNPDAPLLRESSLNWLISPVLAVVAFQGARAYGIETQRFQQAVARLMGARLLEASAINLKLVHASETLASVPAASWWDGTNDYLVIARDQADWLESLSEPLSQIVDRADLGIPLRLMLVSLGGNADPSPDMILAALDRLGIDQKGLRAANLAIVGDLEWLVERSRPLRQLLSPDSDPGEFFRPISETELRNSLEVGLGGALPLEECLEICRNSANDRDLGFRLYEHLGNQAELEHWNRALVTLGHPYSEVRSTTVQEEFSTLALALRPTLRAIARFLSEQSGDPTNYIGMKDVLDGITCPDDWPTRFWNVSFQHVTSAHVDALATCGVTPAILQVFRSSTCAEELHRGLEKHGVQLGIDPADVQAQNQRNLRAVLDQLIGITMVWCDTRKIAAEDWITDSREIQERAEQWASRAGYVTCWSQAECYRSVLSFLPRSAAYDELWQVAERCSGPVELLGHLGFSKSALDDADEQVRRLRDNEQRKKRLVDVCGREFDSDASNLVELWKHITELMPAGGSVDLSVTADLAEVPSSRRRGESGGGRGKKKGFRTRLSQGEKELLGLAGEIHAFRALQSQYGVDHVSAANWISENSRYCFPNNDCDDDRGYDLELTLGRKSIFIEVKATQDDSEMLNLGESQVRAALRSLQKGRSFLILRVSHALSASPTIEVLPNPYDPKAAKYYSFEEAGMRIRFRRRCQG